MSDKEKQEKKENENIIYILTAVLVVCVIVATIFVSRMGSKGSTEGDAATAGATSTEAGALPSWTAGSPALAQIQAFVEDVTNPDSPNYVEPEDRIATFDMDGTIMCEKAPIYVDYCMTIYRVLDDPSYTASDIERDHMQQVRDHAYTDGSQFIPDAPNKDTLVTDAFAGMTQKQFRDYVVNFADNTPVVGFSNMTYGQSFYKPMIEIFDYLRANDFDIWMVSASEREVVRALVDRFGIPADHVIATDTQMRTTRQGEMAGIDYNMGSDEEIILWTPLGAECGKANKALAIAREIGKRPIIAFGNSAGDYSMLNYAKGNPDHRGMGVLIVCDDVVREYGNAEKAQEYLQMVAENEWCPVSMANDWATIYGEGVEKTGLPLAQTAEAAPAEELAPAA